MALQIYIISDQVKQLPNIEWFLISIFWFSPNGIAIYFQQTF